MSHAARCTDGCLQRVSTQVRTAVILDKEARPSTDVMWEAWKEWLPERVSARLMPAPCCSAENAWSLFVCEIM